jgi:hypothetical protein
VILGFCIEKKFVQPMLNFLGAKTTRHALLGLMKKIIVCEINAERKKSMAKLCFIDLGAYIKHNIFLQSQNSQVELGLLHPF